MGWQIYNRRARGEGNLRGERVTFRHPVTGTPCLGQVITRIRDDRWMIHSSRLPREYQQPDGTRRIILERKDFEIEL